MAAARKSKSPINQPRYRINLTLKALTIPSEADPNRTLVSGAVREGRPYLAGISGRRRASASSVARRRVRPVGSTVAAVRKLLGVAAANAL